MAFLNQISSIAVVVYLLSTAVMGFYVVDKSLAKQWSGWFDSDDETATGDHETVEHIRKIKGSRCSHSVQCSAPLGMEVLTVHDTEETDNILDCLYIRKEYQNPAIGFACMNEDQPGRYMTEGCLQMCRRFNVTNEDGTDCVKCPDFKVRYSCPDDTSLWDCRDDSPDTSQVANDGNLGEDAFTDLNPDQQDTMTELVSLLKQLLGQLTDDS